jgi:hypothetical protein
MSLSERLRAGVEVAPWVIESVIKLEEQLSSLRAENETLNAAAQFKVQHGGFTQLRDAVMEVCV